MNRRSAWQRQKDRLLARWSEEDYPGGKPRFQLKLLAKDIVVFCLVPLLAILLFKIVENSLTYQKRPAERRNEEKANVGMENSSQIISFGQRRSTRSGANGGKYGFSKKAPGTLVRVRLLNSVETFSNAPAHAQVIDTSLGREFLGGTLIGEATPEPGNGRIVMNFKFVRHPRRADIAVPISARSLSLNGTYGIDAAKKEGFFARLAIRSANGGGSIDSSSGKEDFKTLVAKAVAQGLMQEFQSEASVANNRAQVLTLAPSTEFFAELTDFFPGQM